MYTPVAANGLRVLLIDTSPSPVIKEFCSACADELSKAGCDVVLWSQLGATSPLCDLILSYGPSVETPSILPADLGALLKQSRGQRPLLVFWLTEGLSDPRVPTWLVDNTGRARRWMDEWAAMNPRHREWLNLLHLEGPWARRGRRLRIFAELRWLQTQGLLDILAVTTDLQAVHLRPFGFNLMTAPIGYHPVYGQDMGLERDVDVCFLAANSPRRRRILQSVQRNLESQGVQVSVQTQLFGSQRNRFLNRTKIMLNILRAPHDFTGMRFMIGAANKSLVMSEPLLDPRPFTPGRHFVVAPAAKIAEKVVYYLDHEYERRAITDQAYRFVTQDLALGNVLGRVLAQAQALRAAN